MRNLLARCRSWVKLRLCFWVIVALLVLQALLEYNTHILSPGSSSNRAVIAPEFVACDLPRKCGPPDARSYYILDLLRQAAATAAERNSLLPPPVILQIGSAGLGGGERFVDVDLLSRALALLPRDTRLVLVEPNTLSSHDIWRNVARLPLPLSHVHVVNAMISGTCEAARIPMYRFSQQAELDFGAQYTMYGTWLGTEPSFPRQALRGWLSASSVGNHRRPSMLSFASAPNISSYVQEVQVLCMTPSALLAEIGVDAEELAMVVIDAEASDVGIVRRFLEVPEFKPGYLQFELGSWQAHRQQELVQELQKHDFVVGRTFTKGQEGSDAENCISVRSSQASPDAVARPLGELQFATCDSPTPCGPGSRALLDLLPRANWSSHAAVARGGSPVFLQIGSDGSASSAVQAISLLPPHARRMARLHFVEPNAERLRGSLVHLPVSSAQVGLCSAVVQWPCAKSHVTVYGFSKKAEEDFGVPLDVYGTWTGSSRSVPLSALETFARTGGKDSPHSAAWGAFARAENRSQYIDEVSLPCLTPLQLLAELDVAAEDLVAVNAVGADCGLVGGLLELPEFRPGFLQYKVCAAKTDEEILMHLESKNFEVGRTYSRQSALGSFIAISGPAQLSTPAPPPLPFQPRFAACSSPGDKCGPSDMESRHSRTLLQVAARMAWDLFVRGRSPVLVHLGAGDLSTADAFADADVLMKVLALLPHALRPHMRLLLVEPAARELEVTTHIERFPLSADHVHVAEKVVSSTCPEEHVTMYSFSSQAEHDFGVSRHTYGSWSGTSSDLPENSLHGFAQTLGAKPGASGGWLAFAQAQNLSAYVEERRVPCVTPLKLLEDAGVDCRDIVMLRVDAAVDADASTVRELLEMPGFKPGYVQYALPQSCAGVCQEVLRTLRLRGFHVGRTFTGSAEHTVAVRSAAPVNARVEPQFFICDKPVTCGPQHSKSYYTLDLIRPAMRAVSKFMERGQKPSILQIGASTLGNSARFADVHLFRSSLSLLAPEECERLRMVFVEPNDQMAGLFWSNVRLLPVNASAVQLIRAMVSEVCTAEQIPMYRFSQEVERDFGLPYEIYGTWLGTEPNFPHGALKGFMSSVTPSLPKFHDWKRFFQATKRSSYVQEIVVPCMTPAVLLKAAGLSAAELPMVIIDAEGSDVGVVNKLLDIPDFKPGFLQFEMYNWGTEAMQGALHKLQMHGFEIGMTQMLDANGDSDAHNVIAIPAAPHGVMGHL